MFCWLVCLAFPEEGLLVERQCQFAGKTSLCAPVVSLSLGVLGALVFHVCMRRLVGDVLRSLHDPVEATHLL